jgi:chromosome segregation ATPase
MERGKSFLSPREEGRYFALVEQFNHFISQVKQDEIYGAMKDSEYSKEYAVQRVKEMFEDAMNNEKEIFISQLEAEIAEEKELSKTINDKNIDLDQEVAALTEQINESLIKCENLTKELKFSEEKRIELENTVKNLEDKQKEFTLKGKEVNLNLARKAQEELEFSRSQTLKFKKELESLQRDNSVSLIKEREYKKDYDEFVLHIKKLSADKECLQNEIEQLSHANYLMKGSIAELTKENEDLLSRIKKLEENLCSEVRTNDLETESILSKFKEKSRKFKSKIIEQRQKLEEGLRFTESLKQSFTNQISELEHRLQDKNLKISDLEHLLQKQEISNNKNQTDKKLLEQAFSSKCSEMQREVETQVKRCQEYEKEVKNLTETKLKALESNNNDLKNAKEELRIQLTSALSSLENLRNAYSEQLAVSEEIGMENQRLKQEVFDLEEAFKVKSRNAEGLEDAFRAEQEKVADLFRLKCELQEQLKRTEENEWKALQEIEKTRKITKKLEDNLENTLRESRNSQRDHFKASELLEKTQILEKFSQNLQNRLQSKNFKLKSLSSEIKMLKNNQKDLKTNFLSSMMILESFIRSLLERLSNKLIEKSSETRKIRSQFDTVKKENSSLLKSVSACSKEMDVLSQELAEKQKFFRDNFKQVKNQLKQKYEVKIQTLENNLIELNREKNKIIQDTQAKVRILQEEILNFQGRDRENAEMFKKSNRFKEDVLVLDKRILELEGFLEEERRQKDQLASLKNKEIEELKSRLKYFTR